MYARIATFEGDPVRVDEAVEAVKGQVEANWSSPPEGLDRAKEMWMLVDREGGKGVGITLYETEEDMRRGDEALNAMSPPVADATGRRTGVALYEVALRKQRD
jgi:hypothetical protein